MRTGKGNFAQSELGQILAQSRAAFIAVAVISAVLNVLMLAGSIFMMLVYDSVLPSRSVPTLVGLLIMIVVVYLFQGVFDVVRGRMLSNVGATVDRGLGARIHEMIGKMALRVRSQGDGLQPVRDLDNVRTFLASAGPAALIDLPWMLFFILVLFLLHYWLGITVLIGALVLVAITFATERMTREPTKQVTMTTGQRSQLAETSRRHAEVFQAMGMGPRMTKRWVRVSDHNLAAQQQLTNVGSTLGGSSKIARLFLQSLVLAVGALLVIDNEATGGIIFASSILAARQSWARLQQWMKELPAEGEVQQLPPPTSTLSVEALSLAPPGANRLTVDGVTFLARAGEAIAVIGPSGSGKSTLVRGICGIWQPVRGTVRLDGAALDQWSNEDLGQHLGYLPQNVELLDGTVAENIARFDPAAASDAVIAAAKLAGVHDLIVRLPEGYQTPVGVDGSSLSAGQRQRIALARALYGDPFLIVLDEPNSNLDADGETALAEAVNSARARGAIVVLVAHRQSILSVVDNILYMRDGRALAYGPKEEVMRKLTGNEPPKKIAGQAAPAAQAAKQA